MAGELTVSAAMAFVQDNLPRSPVIHSTADPEEVGRAQNRFGRQPLAEKIERFFGELAMELRKNGVVRLAVGGGETSGAVVTALGLENLLIGPEIDPGVPALESLGGRTMRLALKSGNFGSVDFYEKALRALGED
jgi:uncharacterized protein YgbK (DUF1537 family)